MAWVIASQWQQCRWNHSGSLYVHYTLIVDPASQYPDFWSSLSLHLVILPLGKCSSGWISYDNYIHITEPDAKKLYLTATFHEAYGHVTLTMSAWPKYGHRSLVGCRSQSAYARRPTVWTETGEPTTYQRPMAVFWSRGHRQRHVTICLMKFAVGERNVAIRYSFFASGCVIWI